MALVLLSSQPIVSSNENSLTPSDLRASLTKAPLRLLMLVFPSPEKAKWCIYVSQLPLHPAASDLPYPANTRSPQGLQWCDEALGLDGQWLLKPKALTDGYITWQTLEGAHTRRLKNTLTRLHAPGFLPRLMSLKVLHLLVSKARSSSTRYKQNWDPQGLPVSPLIPFWKKLCALQHVSG